MGNHKKFTRGLAAALLVAAATPAPALAWGYEGHKIVAAIARSYLLPAVQAKIDALLAADTDTLEPHDMLSAATWADTYRNSHRETSQWHFVDLELDHPDGTAACFGYPASAKPASAGPAQDCITDRIKAFEAELADPATPQAERILALKFVLHLVGDVHQPLHAADNHDHGGNCVPVALGPKVSNLHSYWDTGVIVEMGKDPIALADKLSAQITPAQKAAWEKGDPETWAAESYKIAKSVVYSIGSRPGCDSLDHTPLAPPASYDEAAKAAVAIQLERAGVRLARVLNQTLTHRQ
jgi:hypothetical protein